MDTLVLRNKTASGTPLSATFLPDQGMNLASFKWGDLEIIDQSTRALFEERYAGLGALIGPHFHRRQTSALPPIADESFFPHIARVKAKGVQEPFSHGIARYAPWKAVATESGVKAILTGKDTWNGVALAALEGQNFTMRFNAELTNEELLLELSIVSDTTSLVGIHYYYHLPNGSGKVTSRIQKHYLEEGVRREVPENWGLDETQKVEFNLDHAYDCTLYPFPNPLEGQIFLDTGAYVLTTKYQAPSQENCWQLYHPKGASFVCIEPISSQDPRHPNLTVSSIRIRLQVAPK